MKYWYEIYIYECALCGHGNTYRERRYTPKPDDPQQRYHFTETCCGHHFL